MTSKEILISFHRKKIKGVCHFLKLIFLILLHIRISSMWVVSHLFLGQKLKFNMNLMANWKTFQILFLSSKTCRNLSFWQKMSRQANRHTYYICTLSSMTSLLVHTGAQPNKCRFLPKNLNQLVLDLPSLDHKKTKIGPNFRKQTMYFKK